MEKSPLQVCSLELEDGAWRALESRLSVYWGPRIAPVFDKIRLYRVAYQQLRSWADRRQRSTTYITVDVLARGEKHHSVVALYTRSIAKRLKTWASEDPRAKDTAERWEQHLEQTSAEIEEIYVAASALARKALAGQSSADHQQRDNPAAEVGRASDSDTVALPLDERGRISLAGLDLAPVATEGVDASGAAVRALPRGKQSFVGRRFGNYEVKKLIGQGGMGAVYLAEHPHLGRRVAVKVLAPHLALHADQVARFAAEAKAIARVSHPNVVEVFDFGQTDEGELYFVMELLDGPDLGELMARQAPFTADETFRFATQLCGALQAAHDQGVVHRDFKPENVVVVSQSPLLVKVVDFGLAKFYEDPQQSRSRTATGLVMGTPLTIAPEQAAGHSHLITPATDLYSLGVVLFWMLAGVPPFDDELAAVLLAKHIRDAPPALQERCPDVPPPLAALVADCLDKEPGRRPQSAMAVVARFAAAIGRQADSLGALPLAGARGDVVPCERSHEQPSKTATTTLRRATGESLDTGAPRSNKGRLQFGLWLSVALIACAGLLLWNPLDRPDEKAPPGMQATKQPRTLPARIRNPAVHEVVVTIHDRRARCRFGLAGGRQKPQHSPCRIRVQGGQMIELEVQRRGYRPYVERWLVTGDRHLDLRLRRRGRRIVARLRK